MVRWLSRSNTDVLLAKTASSTVNSFRLALLFRVHDTVVTADVIVSAGQRCRGDRSAFCRMESLSGNCANAGYRQMCCKTCGNFR